MSDHAMNHQDTTSDEPLVLNRDQLRLYKYTRWAAELSADEMYGLLWLLGEFGIRTSAENLPDSIREKGRARTGLLGALGFVHGRPLSKDKALSAIRNAYKNEITPAFESQRSLFTNKPETLEDNEQ
jgi:hypothetical protein